jgi:dTDP-4-dehydrorhamnose 3,5-epimerase
MLIEQTPLRGSYLITPEPVNDERGFFARFWCKREVEKIGLNADIVQSSLSFNHKAGTVRGMHYQGDEGEEAKYVRCIRGRIYDVIVDIRHDSATYLKWFGVELSEDNRNMLYIPNGFAHGFQTLTDNAELEYYITEYYEPAKSRGIRWNDPAISIEWPMQVTCISERDEAFGDFRT